MGWKGPLFPRGPVRINRESPQATGLRCLVKWGIGGTIGSLSDLVTRQKIPLTGGTVSSNFELRMTPNAGLAYTPVADDGLRFLETLAFTPNNQQGTISAWLKVTGAGTSNWRSGQIGNYYADRFLMLSYFASGALRPSANLVVSDVPYITSPLLLSADSWHLVAVRFDLVNTNLLDITAPAMNGSSRYASVDITGLTPSFESYWVPVFYLRQGQAEVRYYDRALSDAEIWSLYDPATRWDLYEPVAPPRFWSLPIAEGGTDTSGSAVAFLKGRPYLAASQVGDNIHLAWQETG